MNRNVIVSCAITGSGDTVGKHPSIPVTPKEIATAAIEAAKAGAAITHIHVREPDGGKPSRRVELYAEVVERIRSSDVDVIINLTTGMGGDLFFGPDDEPMSAYEEWRSKAEALASVDFSFHMSVVRFDAAARDQFRRIVLDEGIPSFKVFLAYKGALDLSDEDLFGALTLAKELGVIVTAHCENAEAIDAMQRRLLGAGRTGPQWHEPSRPTSVELSWPATKRSRCGTSKREQKKGHYMSTQTWSLWKSSSVAAFRLGISRRTLW